MRVKKIYLFGGFGNILYQIDHGIRSQENCIFITNLVEDRWYSNIFGWTHHGNILDKSFFQNDVVFKRNKFISVIWDLFCLFLTKKLSIKTHIGWETSTYKKVIFGYFQYPRQNRSLKLNLNCNSLEINKTVIHVRLGDSPTLTEDVRAQIQFIMSYNKKEYLIITNDIKRAKELFNFSEFKFDFFQSTPYIDFFIMSNCTELICPKSTFSIMAANLNYRLEKLIVPRDYWESHKISTNAILIYY